MGQMVRDLIIIGAGGHGREVLSVVDAINATVDARPWRVLGFVADDPVTGEALRRVERTGQRVIGTIDEAAEAHPGCHVVVAIGEPLARADVAARAQRSGLVLAPALVHPSSSVGIDVVLGPGVVVQAGSHLTTNVRLGAGVQVNVSCSVSHDVELRDHVTLSPGCRLTGGVVVGHGAFFGVGAVVAPGIVIGAHARVGAGSVVLHDVPAGETVHGAPARVPAASA